MQSVLIIRHIRALETLHYVVNLEGNCTNLSAMKNAVQVSTRYKPFVDGPKPISASVKFPYVVVGELFVQYYPPMHLLRYFAPSFPQAYASRSVPGSDVLLSYQPTSDCWNRAPASAVPQAPSKKNRELERT
jgi:hypothetical protein